jgi:AMP-polyphosphate phosphotransferase
VFETAELGLTVDKETYNREVPVLRAALLNAQQELAQSSLGVVVIVGGVEGAGKSDAVNLLLEWMDARGIQTHAFFDSTQEENERPPHWRFWRILSPRGHLAILFGSWYTQPIIDRVFRRLRAAEFEHSLDRIVQLEEMLDREHVVVVKYWMHLSPAVQRARLKALRKDPNQQWRVTKRDRQFVKRADVFRQVSEYALQKTNTAHAPWHLVDATDARYRNLTVARTLLQTLRQRLQESKTRVSDAQQVLEDAQLPRANLLSKLDLNLRLKENDYQVKLDKLQDRLGYLIRQLRERGRSLILVFEGPDAAGKGGAIRRLTRAMDARDYRVICVGVPTDEERARPYLWRFWRHVPGPGRVAIYDRSWYGRVLVERLEGLCAPAEWQRAYGEINAFESQLVEFGIVVRKFWLAISPEEQLRRFKDRQTTPYKIYKLTQDDWRNREKWAGYQRAACEMIEKTSTIAAPWILVEAENKEWARIKVLKAVVDCLKCELVTKHR